MKTISDLVKKQEKSEETLVGENIHDEQCLYIPKEYENGAKKHRQSAIKNLHTQKLNLFNEKQ